MGTLAKLAVLAAAVVMAYGALTGRPGRPGRPGGPAHPSANVALAERMAAHSYGWTGQQGNCLYTLWQGESNFDQYATNPSSGAYGIPQSLPAQKMAAAGPNWRTSPRTQIRWGLRYISRTYGSPCAALAFKRASGNLGY